MPRPGLFCSSQPAPLQIPGKPRPSQEERVPGPLPHVARITQLRPCKSAPQGGCVSKERLGVWRLQGAPCSPGPFAHTGPPPGMHSPAYKHLPDPASPHPLRPPFPTKPHSFQWLAVVPALQSPSLCYCVSMYPCSPPSVPTPPAALSTGVTHGWDSTNI